MGGTKMKMGDQGAEGNIWPEDAGEENDGIQGRVGPIYSTATACLPTAKAATNTSRDLDGLDRRDSMQGLLSVGGDDDAVSEASTLPTGHGE